MPLIIETGAGLADADSFVTIDEFKAYAEKRGLTELANLPDGDIEAAARAATEYADTYKRYKGRAQSREQALQFPRIELQDWSSYEVTGIPLRLKQAVMFLMATALSGTPLYETLDGQAIITETVGPISTTYAQPVGVESRHRVFTTADKLLAQYVRDPNGPRPVPGFAGSDPGSFYAGRQDFPGTAGPGLDYTIDVP